MSPSQLIRLAECPQDKLQESQGVEKKNQIGMEHEMSTEKKETGNWFTDHNE